MAEKDSIYLYPTGRETEGGYQIYEDETGRDYVVVSLGDWATNVGDPEKEGEKMPDHYVEGDYVEDGECYNSEEEECYGCKKKIEPRQGRRCHLQNYKIFHVEHCWEQHLGECVEEH